MTALLADLIEVGAAGGGHLTLAREPEPTLVGWAEVLDRSYKVAGSLQAIGVEPDFVVGLVGGLSLELVTALVGVWLSGATPCLLPPKVRGQSLEGFIQRTVSQIAELSPTLTIAEPEVAVALEGATGVIDYQALNVKGRYEQPQVDDNSTAILQLTSGSTGNRKGVAISHANVAANCEAIRVAAGLAPGVDSFASWLPLYHDMGLIGCFIVPLIYGMDLWLTDPESFLKRPLSWLQGVSLTQASVTVAPHSAYAYAARFLGPEALNVELSSLRLAFNGAERIDPAAARLFGQVASGHGFSENAMYPVYGMAESTLAISFPEPDSGFRTCRVSQQGLSRGEVADPVSHSDVSEVALLGRAVPGMDLRIVDREDHDPVPDGELGEVAICGNSLADHYVTPDGNVPLSDAEGWFRTGDIGFEHAGELAICGRIKDLIIIGGRNISPDEVEWAVARLPGVRAGNVAAISVDGPVSERLVVVAESSTTDLAELRSAIQSVVRASLGVAPHDVRLVEPRTLPKTPSGKLMRWRIKADYRDGVLIDR